VHFGAGEGPGVAGEVVAGRVVAVGGVYGRVGSVAVGSTPGGSPPVGTVAGTLGTTGG
jgi:hypothetical protein